ncbi:hypothetical protein JZ751_011104 [Albula glossodonta]|uniref:Saposin B-type domain-containing protein n=1 Tax=Albula glossodonta TaxID=121402 RepID=A0A8T2NWC2_9TELE|nr:hypothetical protein JZ751_011104 [Albula glossodonta]
MDKANFDNGGFCDVCKMAVRYIDGILEQNATEAEIEDAVRKVCNFLPEAVRTECDQLVQQYEPMLVQLLLQMLDPDFKLGACPEAVVRLLGTEQCSWGPAFWLWIIADVTCGTRGWGMAGKGRQEEGHDNACGLGQLPRHHLGPIDHRQGAQIAIAEAQQGHKEHREQVVVEQHSLQVVPGLVVAEHEERHQDSAGEDQSGQHPAGRARDMEPGSGLPPTEVRCIVQEEADWIPEDTAGKTMMEMKKTMGLRGGTETAPGTPSTPVHLSASLHGEELSEDTPPLLQPPASM